MATRTSRKEKAADALRSIGEAASELDLQAHVLRYWETKFPKQVKPLKRADGRRMFRPEDMDALRAIQILVHERGLTLKGAKALLTEQSVGAVLSGNARLVAASVDLAPRAAIATSSPARDLQQVISKAFGAAIPDNTQTATGSPERLQSVLVEMSDLKRRLDALREARAA